MRDIRTARKESIYAAPSLMSHGGAKITNTAVMKLIEFLRLHLVLCHYDCFSWVTFIEGKMVLYQTMLHAVN